MNLSDKCYFYHFFLSQKKLEKETPPLDGQKKRLLSETNAVSRPKKLKVIRSCGATSSTKPVTPATVTPKSSCKHIRKSPVHGGETTEGETGPHETAAVS